MADRTLQRAVARNAAAPILQVKGLNVYYGHSHALQGVDLTLDRGVLSVVGRNGMGKTTLCKAIMGLVRASSGSIRFRGEELTRRRPAEIARLGIGYVPQGRRLWPSLTVDEHLRLMQGSQRSGWTIERIYEAFPQLAARKNHRGGELSGGEQQMLAISRALLLNPRLLVMDEPTEGLAPVIVAQVEEMLIRLAEEGDVAVLVIEQNIGVATAVASRVAIMVNGRINRVIDSARLAADLDLQQRLLGVGRHSADDHPAAADAADDATPGAPAVSRSAGPQRIYVSNPNLPTRWSQPASVLQIEARARTNSGAGRGRADAFDRAGFDHAARVARRPGRSGCRHPRHQGRRAALHSRHPQGRRHPHAAGRPVDQRQALGGRRGADRDRVASPVRRQCRVHRRPRQFRRRHGAGVRGVDAPPERDRRHHRRRRLGRHLDGRAGDAVAADRRAEDHDLHGRLRRRAALRRRLRHPDDVLGHRRAGPQFDLAPDPRQRRAGHARHGQGARCRDGAGSARAARRGRSFPRSGSPCSASPRRACSRSPAC